MYIVQYACLLCITSSYVPGLNRLDTSIHHSPHLFNELLKCILGCVTNMLIAFGMEKLSAFFHRLILRHVHVTLFHGGAEEKSRNTFIPILFRDVCSIKFGRQAGYCLECRPTVHMLWKYP